MCFPACSSNLLSVTSLITLIETKKTDRQTDKCLVFVVIRNVFVSGGIENQLILKRVFRARGSTLYPSEKSCLAHVQRPTVQ